MACTGRASRRLQAIEGGATTTIECKSPPTDGLQQTPPSTSRHTISCIISAFPGHYLLLFFILFSSVSITSRRVVQYASLMTKRPPIDTSAHASVPHRNFAPEPTHAHIQCLAHFRGTHISSSCLMCAFHWRRVISSAPHSLPGSGAGFMTTHDLYKPQIHPHKRKTDPARRPIPAPPRLPIRQHAPTARPRPKPAAF